MSAVTPASSSDFSSDPPFVGDVWKTVQAILAPFASLKLTVVLFLFSIWLILVGTLAQAEMNMWEVMDQYFRSLFAWMEFKHLVPLSFFPDRPEWIRGGMYIPGGLMLGGLLALNLFAAHISRFKVQAKGNRLWAGLAVIALGAFLTTLVVLGGHNANGMQGKPLLSWDQLWMLMRFALCAAWIGSVILLLVLDRKPILRFVSLIVLSAVLGVAAVYLVATGDTTRLGDSSLRILWQLIQGGAAGIILLIGCVMVFKKRGGIVLIHAGVGLLMLGELLVGVGAVEEQITLIEGQSTQFARDTRKVEIAVIDRSPTDHDHVTVIPHRYLKDGESISDESLPFDIEVVEYLKNANLRPPQPNDVNPATTGAGLRLLADPARSAGGAEADQTVDIGAVYIKVTPKLAGADSQTYLLAQHFGDSDVLLRSRPAPVPETITVGDKQYDVLLRYKRNYKPYSLKLKDVSKDDYIGTSTPKDYSSWVSLTDESRDFTRDKIRIWMNNPLRYAGETFYQSGYNRDDNGEESTTLQVVTNRGWMIPYVACMLALVGLAYHFLQTLMRFLNRYETRLVKEKAGSSESTDDKQRTGGQWLRGLVAGWGVPAVFVLIWLLYVGGKMAPRSIEHEGMQLDKFANVPVVFGGRVKPIGTLARNMLRRISDKPDLYVPKADKPGRFDKEPALRWLLDIMTQEQEAVEHQVVLIPNLDVQTTLGLDRRKRFRYSVSEISKGIEAFEKEAIEARKLAKADASKLTFYQRKLLETDRRLSSYSKLQSSFLPIPFPRVPTKEETLKDPGEALKRREEIARLAQATPRLNQTLMAMQPPLIVPISNQKLWLPFAAAANEAYVKSIFSNETPDERVRMWTKIISAYSNGDARSFNREVASYLKDLERNPPEEYDPAKVRFESFYNRFNPFTTAYSIYFFAGLMVVFGWVAMAFGKSDFGLQRTAFCLIILAFLVHTFALGARIYISGRPPVTNLYSSAVFIGWGTVVFGLVIEGLFKMGIGNAIGTTIGAVTLIIADKLAMSGDTFTVMQAVLDTQFWLATHVVCISLGYVATFVAGGIAIIYLLGGILGRSPAVGNTLARICYGVVCFAIIFSFIGTVLGGLWADDSWGRFWGWDPKENGALMIVLWNAVILHARWGGMVKDRGLAVLAVIGNIVTAWSWFGVNELGVGLHSYGFTEGVLVNLGWFVLSQLAICLVGVLPFNFWQSSTSTSEAAPSVAELAS